MERLPTIERPHPPLPTLRLPADTPPHFLCSQGNGPLAHLDIGNCDLHTDAVIAIATALHGNTNLRELCLDNTRTFSKMVCQSVRQSVRQSVS